MKSLFSVLVLLLISAKIFAQENPPIIDMHLHAYPAWPEVTAADSAWIPLDLYMPATNEKLMQQSLTELRRYNIIKAAASGPAELVEIWKTADQERIIPAIQFNELPDDPSSFLDSLRVMAESGRLSVLGELGTQYAGISPSDSVLEPYFALAEELDIPVAIHMGLGPPGRAYQPPHTYRANLSNPILLEEALVRHPDLRIYVMHAGWPFLDEMVALMQAHPQVYVDVGVINWYIPRAEFHAYLKRLINAGFEKRIMFGSDQMNWPGAIGKAIEGIESAEFLSDVQTRDIFCNNAARFLRLESNTCKDIY